MAACAAAGTDYVDLTGEAEFVDRMYVAHHATAAAHRRPARARVRVRLGAARPRRAASRSRSSRTTGPVTLRGVVRAGGDGLRRHASTPRSPPSRARSRCGRPPRHGAAASPAPRDAVAGRRGQAPPRPELGCWLLPLPTIDPFVVARSGAALAAYGPDFPYCHYAGTKTLRYAAGGAAGRRRVAVAAPGAAAASARCSAGSAGRGPDEARRERSWFTVDFVGEAGQTHLHTRVSGGDPGYGETAKMLAESALCLAFDDNPPTSGQVTTAQAMGDALLERLQRAGLRFEVVDLRSPAKASAPKPVGLQDDHGDHDVDDRHCSDDAQDDGADGTLHGVLLRGLPDDCAPTTSGVRRPEVLRESPAERSSASSCYP